MGKRSRDGTNTIDGITIKTSENRWLEKLAKSYKEGHLITLIDNANVGINPQDQSLFDMGIRAKLSSREWIGVLVAVGMTLAGAAMVLAAILDPEPTSKLGLLVLSGSIICFSGGGTAIYIVTRKKPPKIKVTRDKEGKIIFEMSW